MGRDKQIIMLCVQRPGDICNKRDSMEQGMRSYYETSSTGHGQQTATQIVILPSSSQVDVSTPTWPWCHRRDDE